MRIKIPLIKEQVRSREETEEEGGFEEDIRKVPPDVLSLKIAKDIKVITDVALMSSNLKGTFVRSLKLAALSIRDVVEELINRMGGAVRQLRRENEKLQGEVSNLREQLQEMRREIKKFRRRLLDSSCTCCRTCNRGIGDGGESSFSRPNATDAHTKSVIKKDPEGVAITIPRRASNG